MVGRVNYFVYKQKEGVGLEHLLCLWAARWNQWTRSLCYRVHRVRRFCLLGQHTSIMDVTLNTSIDMKLYHFLHCLFPAGRVHWTREKEILIVICDAADCVSVTTWLLPHFSVIVKKISITAPIGLVFYICVSVYNACKNSRDAEWIFKEFVTERFLYRFFSLNLMFMGPCIVIIF